MPPTTMMPHMPHLIGAQPLGVLLEKWKLGSLLSPGLELGTVLLPPLFS